MKELSLKEISDEQMREFRKNWEETIMTLGEKPIVVGGETMEIKYYSEGVELRYGTEFAAGIDLPFFDPELETYTFKPGEIKMLKTGVHAEYPEGYYAKLDMRSSSAKKGLGLLCSTVDNDYRGNIRLMVINASEAQVTIERGQMLAQMVLLPYIQPTLVRVESVDDLEETKRGDKGFGSTGQNFKETEGGIQG